MKDDSGRERNPVLWTAVGSALGLALLYAATRTVDLEELAATLRTTAPGWAAGVLAATLGFTLIKAWRWRLLLRFIPDPGFHRLHAAVYVGLAMNFLIAHVGEFLRASEIARSSGTPVSAVLATVVIERMLDFLALLLLLLAVCLLAPVPDFIKTAAFISAAILLAGFVTIALLLRPPQWMSRVLVFGGGALPERLTAWCGSQFAQLRTGMAALGQPGMMTAALLASVLQWILVMAAIACSAWAVGAAAGVVPVAAAFVLIILGLMLPNPPMQIGPTQLAFTIGLGTSGIQATDAVAASLVYTLFLIVPVMAIGGACLIRRQRHRLTLR